MRGRTVAPAKINWTLEVLGKREDGYHEIKSVMQTIDLCDEVVVEEREARSQESGWVRTGSAALRVVEGDCEATEDDLTLRAVRALEKATGRELPVAIRLVKRIPVAAGLGGGSSDAAAVLRMVDRLYGLGLSREELAVVGARVGSDVPFFVYGGTALAEGRGERVTALPDNGVTWVVVIVREHEVVEKTRTMYEKLDRDDYTDGRLSEVLAADVMQGLKPDNAPSHEWLRLLREGARPRPNNVFDRYEYAAPSLEAELIKVMTRGVQVAGSGPGLFGVRGSGEEALSAARWLMRIEGVRSFAARTLGAEEATRVVVE
jgi:4-diphosphocytidyl-2-C-methyl-D-erythritol kinase